MSKRILHIIIVIIFIVSCRNSTHNNESHHQSAIGHDGMVMQDSTRESSYASTADSSILNVLAPVNNSVLSNAETIHPVILKNNETIHANGYIDFDERRNNIVAVRTGGRVEKLYIKLDYQYVHKGDRILELYSPELNSYQEEYLHHLRTSSDGNLIEATRKKLELLGLSNDQLGLIESSGRLLESITVYSPYDGYILYNIERQQKMPPQTASPDVQEMSGMSESANMPAGSVPFQNNGGSRLREGDYVDKGQTLFVLNDCKEVYAIVSFNARDALKFSVNQPVKIMSRLLKDEPIYARINFMEPVFQAGQKFMQVRVYLKNEESKLKIYSLVNAELQLTDEYIALPSSAVLSLGNRHFVWVNKGISKGGVKILEAREIIIGKESNGYTEIISGVTLEEEIARHAAYLLDSESIVKPNDE